MIYEGSLYILDIRIISIGTKFVVLLKWQRCLRYFREIFCRFIVYCDEVCRRKKNIGDFFRLFCVLAIFIWYSKLYRSHIIMCFSQFTTFSKYFFSIIYVFSISNTYQCVQSKFQKKKLKNILICLKLIYCKTK